MNVKAYLEITMKIDAAIDPAAFVSVFDISEAHGGLFKRRKSHG